MRADTKVVRVVSLSVVLAAVVAVIGVFTFAKPRYHAPGCGGCRQLSFPDAKPPANGWLWADSTPGFHFGEGNQDWRMLSRVDPRDVPPGAGILIAETTGPPIRTTALYAPRNGCIGIRLRDGSRTTLCRPRAASVFVAEAVPRNGDGWNMFLIGVARSDVTRITVRERKSTFTDMRSGARVVKPMPPQVVYDRKTAGMWGSWTISTGQPVPWDATVKVFGRYGLMATTHVTFAAPGQRLYCASALRGACGTSAQRRS